jgi:hypothetical protein
MDRPIKLPYFDGSWLFQVYCLVPKIYPKRICGPELRHEANRTAAKSGRRWLRMPAGAWVSTERARNRDKFTAFWRHSL